MKVSAYPGMNLRGEVRESISLDEDDLSDVEDEVFIRDGKNGYKLADELTVKRPLMAPRRKGARPDLSTRLKGKPPCKALCRPCCYVFVALSILIGLIILVVVLVSIYPLPLDKLKDWLIKKSQKAEVFRVNKLLPCDNLKVTDVWSLSLPKLTTDSPVRSLDVDNDNVEDVIFGFGTGDNYNILPSDLLCPIFLGVPSPCKGGIIAVNGATGDIIWRRWFNDTIFSIECNADVNGDQQNDCLIVGIEGTIAMINSKNGTLIWILNTGKLNVYVASFIPDQNNDSISDIVASHSSINNVKDGHIVLFSGKTGEELKNVKTPGDAKIFYMPQLLVQNNGSKYLIFGTGSPSTGGNLTVAPIDDVNKGVFSGATKTIYEDKFKGILTQSVLVDISGDGTPDIVTAMYNSTLVAINGNNFEQIWNYTVPGRNPETNISPTPGYFNYDNITDFLIIYQQYDDILNYNYTQTYIIDGITGKPIDKPLAGGLITQTSGLTVSLESYGYDMYLFWTSECSNLKKSNEVTGINDMYGDCSNNTVTLKLNALSQFHQPPGFVIYNSAEKLPKGLNKISVLKQLKEYYKSHPKIIVSSPGQSEIDENYKGDPVPIGIKKYGSSSFRHKDRNSGIENYMVPTRDEIENFQEERDSPLIEEDYDTNYYPTLEETIPYNKKQTYEEKSTLTTNNRDPRSKENKLKTTKPEEISTSKKKNLSDQKKGIYNYNNVRRSRNRLLHDVDYVPTEILKDTYVKNEEMRLRKSRFEERDVNTHIDKIKEKEEIQNIIRKQIEEARKNASLSLWDLESEKEMKEWLDGHYNNRAKRDVNFTLDGSFKVTSVGTILDSLNTTNTTNSFDIVFITYWQPLTKKRQDILKQDIQDCIKDKFEQDKSPHNYQKTTEEEQRELYKSECLEEQTNLKNEFNFFNQLHLLRLGEMTVHRIRVECECINKKEYESCARFLPKNRQSWPSYLGKMGDGVFIKRE